MANHRGISKSAITFELVQFGPEGAIEQTFKTRDAVPCALQSRVRPAYVIRSFLGTVLAARTRLSDAIAFAEAPAAIEQPIIRLSSLYDLF